MSFEEFVAEHKALNKLCVEAATEVMAQRMAGPVVLFKDIEAAIDAYLACAARHIGGNSHE